ncbi:hypothetical protein KAR34_13820 [bacterium]|nr:hypothetical protein [bacterium]
MGLIFGILAVVLVLFLIFAMALAEWADKDIGELFAAWRKKTGLATQPVYKADPVMAVGAEIPAKAKSQPKPGGTKVVKPKPAKAKKSVKKTVKKTVRAMTPAVKKVKSTKIKIKS